MSYSAIFCSLKERYELSRYEITLLKLEVTIIFKQTQTHS
ncbi:hypothetical protein HCH_06850 [Hahella chejuensis KCTC 2396]|uniref:Uncharacterized protein n=1 Tax=Hahella chejuensis (strain KCTC 2396) TaxID=349521 RepID=Q2S7A4_HAHCH|nr:hypothetical protein HCH_06850 [Hahella chejuensis KCTC 2396]